jgi:hypothetical protein
VAACIVDQVPHHPAQQRTLAAHRDARALDRDAVARGLLGGEREQVDLLVALRRADRIEPARQQDLLDQLIELVDVGFQLARAGPDRSPIARAPC